VTFLIALLLVLALASGKRDEWLIYRERAACPPAATGDPLGAGGLPDACGTADGIERGLAAL